MSLKTEKITLKPLDSYYYDNYSNKFKILSIKHYIQHDYNEKFHLEFNVYEIYLENDYYVWIIEKKRYRCIISLSGIKIYNHIPYIRYYSIDNNFEGIKQHIYYDIQLYNPNRDSSTKIKKIENLIQLKLITFNGKIPKYKNLPIRNVFS